MKKFFNLTNLPLFILLIFLSTNATFGQSLNSYFTTGQLDAKTHYPLIFLNTQPALAAPLQWETIQTTYIQQADPNSPLPPVRFNLDQVRNGAYDAPTSSVTPAPWVNGNAGASNAHYVEGWSIPYRMVIENLPLGAHSVDIEWDIKHSGANAIDFITNFDMIDYPANSHVFNFGHNKEMINPVTEAGTWVSGTSLTIPAPNLPAAPLATFNAIQAVGTGTLGKFGVFNASITGLTYLSQGNLLAAQSSTRMRIFFTNTNETVIISWGGHIAKEADWGAGNSAVAVSGSPYHTRIIEWDPDGAGAGGPSSIGNQDRSLSADAVLDPPICDLTGPSTVECASTSTFFSGVDQSDLSAGVTFEWTLVDNTSGATKCGESVSQLCVNTGSGCGTGFTVRYRLLKNGAQVGLCNKIVTVTDTQAPSITCPAAPVSPVDCPATPSFGTPTASDACGTPTVTSADSDVQGSCAGTYTRTRKWTATDACGNTATCSQAVTVRDITAPVITCPTAPTSPIDCPNTPVFGEATATDACSVASITSSDSDAPGSCAGTYTRTRKWTAIDACGNTSTCSRSVTVRDITPPVITCPSAPTSPIDCPNTPVFGEATASDGCSVASVTSSDSDAPGTCAGTYTRTRKWTATDACGNTSTCSQSVTVRDITPPVITSCPANVVVECTVNVPLADLGTAVATDACSVPTVTSSDGSPVVRGCVTVITRIWRARDACGNTATCSQVITKRDRTGPVINCTNGTATDNCSPVGDITIYQSNGVWTAIDGSGNITTATANCSEQGSGSRLAPSAVTTDNKEQTITVSEEPVVKPDVVIRQLPTSITVQAIPNPFNDRVKFIVTSPKAGYGSLDVLNMLGQKVKTVFQGQLSAGSQTFEMSLPTGKFATLFYILRVDGKQQVSGKLVQSPRY